MIKELRFSVTKNSMGILGEPVGYGLYVGDLVAVLYEDRIVIDVICKDWDGQVFQMGLKSVSLEEQTSQNKMTLVTSFKNLTNDILQDLDGVLEIAEVEAKKMTLEEIQNKLGYRIEIVK